MTCLTGRLVGGHSVSIAAVRYGLFDIVHKVRHDLVEVSDLDELSELLKNCECINVGYAELYGAGSCQ